MNKSKKTKNLILRYYTSRDYEAWKKNYSQLMPAQNIWDLSPRPISELTRTQFKKVLKIQKEQREAGKFYDFSVFHQKTGELIGTVALMDLSRGVFQNAYIGYRVFNRHWKKGFGKEMLKAALELAFKDFKLHRVEAGIDPKNKASIALAKSVRMRKEGLKKRALFLNGKWQDILVFALTTEDMKIKFKGDLKAMSVRIR